MSFDRLHEIHTRRFGRNLGVGAVLLMLVGSVFGLTVVKVTHVEFEVPSDEVSK